MLEYEWSNLMNSSSIMLPVDEMAQQVDPQQTRPVYNPETHFTPTPNFTEPANFFNPETHYHHQTQLHFHHHHPISNTTHFTNLYEDPRAYASYSQAPPSGSMLVEPGPDQTGFMVVPKPEPVVEFNSRIGLNLGGRTYFASSEDDFVNRLYRRSRLLEPGSMNTPRCQAEGCNADLSQSKHYHRRHKVCEYHSKAATVVAGGLTQRFCQQCSRFHVLSEFDNGKRSCRRRLADHNRRRRKSSQKSSSQENNNNKEDTINAPKSSSSEKLPRSPPDSSGPHSSSVTAALSPPRISLDCLGYRPYNIAATSSSTASTTSLFYTNE